MTPTGSAAIVWLVIIISSFVAANSIGKRKNRQGWIYALLGGWIGVLVLVCLSPVGPKVDPVLEAKERRVRELELDARLAELETSRTVA